MLCIFTTDGHEIEWHVGEPAPEMWGASGKLDSALQRISYVQADGHELSHILSRFTCGGRPTIPMPDCRVCRWYGDLARTIYLNL